MSEVRPADAKVCLLPSGGSSVLEEKEREKVREHVSFHGICSYGDRQALAGPVNTWPAGVTHMLACSHTQDTLGASTSLSLNNNLLYKTER